MRVLAKNKNDCFYFFLVGLVLAAAVVVSGAEHASKIPATSAAQILTEENFFNFLQTHDSAFVDFDAPWCVWCQRLLPTWDKFAQEVKKQKLPLGVGRMDCMSQADLCRKQKIMAFPTLRWFRKGEAETPDYKMDRTVYALMDFAKRKLHIEDKDKSGDDKESGEEEKESGDEDAPDDGVAIPNEIHGQSHSKTDMFTKCQSAGLSYGKINQRFSQMGGNEFTDYNALQQAKIAPTCHSASSNARGTYNSFFSPCEFQFHVIPNGKRSSSSSFHLSTGCSSGNVYNADKKQADKEEGGDPDEEETLMDYVRGWPDECVGDYRRCYSVSKDSEAMIFLPHFCRNNWEIPEAVTHISVTCKDDKVEAIKKQQEASENKNNSHIGNMHLAQMAKHHRERLVILLIVVALACCCCWTVLCLGYTHVVVPYLKAIKRSKSDPDLQSLVNAVDGTKETATPTANIKMVHI